MLTNFSGKSSGGSPRINGLLIWSVFILTRNAAKLCQNIEKILKYTTKAKGRLSKLKKKLWTSRNETSNKVFSIMWKGTTAITKV